MNASRSPTPDPSSSSFAFKVSPPPSSSSRFGVETKALRNTDRYWSLFFLVVVPYLKSKADDYYKQLSGRSASLLWSDTAWSPPSPTFPSPSSATSSSSSPASFFRTFLRKLRWLFINIWPMLNAVYEGLFFVYQLLYMYDYTRYYTPFVHLQGVEHRRLSLQDLEEQDRQTLRRRRVELRELAAWSAGLGGGKTEPCYLLLFCCSLKLVNSYSFFFLQNTRKPGLKSFRVIE
jgi:hypothetical protein